jgi:hypothetical protein
MALSFFLLQGSAWSNPLTGNRAGCKWHLASQAVREFFKMLTDSLVNLQIIKCGQNSRCVATESNELLLVSRACGYF